VQALHHDVAVRLALFEQPRDAHRALPLHRSKPDRIGR
jgi:hypothetical protein